MVNLVLGVGGHETQADQGVSRFDGGADHGVDEPPVPTEVISLRDFVAEEPFDLVFVSESPGAVPEEWKWLESVASEYVQPRSG